ncbi:hypothetical protein SAMD00019534_058080 [Acytostelium subglobosum LB1]|uniref:hypothetical protein n=1 Tax=Acytostelium subglobosum LB1 TaxID=1410327 RepID=UPI000644D4B6|nr:hypothetical protein SAMD00019534_058080 [Acytostelium subglobosum LB1]GAM22633.1 hypothetical protein SAMD00019534_058080 [Acytostelium subglobosum LB1]|eukprot:XP_012754753.1 hypothetical protein SAMD00019534_058080 [Acytostelium subglobosum LB1]
MATPSINQSFDTPSSTSTSSSTFDTPSSNINTIPTTKSIKKQQQQDDDITNGVRLDQFVANYTSEDDHSFNEIQVKQMQEHQRKHKWMEDRTQRLNNTLMLENGGSEGKSGPDTWKHTVINKLMYYPQGQSVSEPSPGISMPPKEIVRENTRISIDLSSSSSTIKESNEIPFNQLSIPEQLALIQRLEREGKSIDQYISSMGFVSTPQATPMSSLGDESPMMTWGRIDGTPLLLPENPISTPLDISGSARGSFKIPQTPARERLAYQMADKANNNSKKVPKKPVPSPLRQGLATSKGALESLSPAAQKLISMRTPNRGGQSPLLAKDQQLRQSYRTPTTPTSKTNNITGTPKPKGVVTPLLKTTPSAPSLSTPSRPTPAAAATGSITDNLLNFG